MASYASHGLSAADDLRPQAVQLRRPEIKPRFYLTVEHPPTYLITYLLITDNLRRAVQLGGSESKRPRHSRGVQGMGDLEPIGEIGLGLGLRLRSRSGLGLGLGLGLGSRSTRNG